MMDQHKRARRRRRWMVPALLGFGLGMILVRAWRYLQVILKRPFYTDIAPELFDQTSDLTAEAYLIAVRDLLRGLEVRSLEDGTELTVLCAGARNFREPWARDTGFAMFGLLELEAQDKAREALEVFLLTQNPSGQFAVKVHSTGIVNRYLHSVFGRQQPTELPIRPKYITAHNTVSLDGNGLLVIAILNYANRFEDFGFVTDNWTALKSALSWLSQFSEDGDDLLRQDPFTDWADTISRKGKILYTNVIYWKALQEMGTFAHRIGHKEDAAAYLSEAEKIKQSILTEFWRADLGYFVTSKVFDNLSSSGNLLAIAWGLADREQAASILDVMRFFGMAVPVPTKAVHLAYPKKFIAIENRLGGIADYHTYFAWLWLGAWHVISLVEMDRVEEAGELIYNMSRVIVRDGAVHEVYAPNGTYASTLWYTSESPLTWSAGMFVYAFNVYRRHVHKNGPSQKDE